jgi:hypothetical protein
LKRLFLLIPFLLLTSCSPVQAQPEIRVVEVIKEVEVEVVKETTVYVEVPVYIKERVKLYEFQSLDELDRFFTDNRDYVFACAYENSLPSKLKCRYYAEEWQKYAAEKGYLLPMQLIEYGHLLDRQVSTTVARHWGNVAIVQNQVYYIESVNEYQIVKVCSQD